MIDLAQLREKPQLISDLILRKEPTFPIDKLLQADAHARSLRTVVENLRKEKNALAALGPKSNTPENREKSIELGKQLKTQEVALEEAEKSLQTLWLSCPNVPNPDLPIGNKEANKAVKVVGSKPIFAHTIKNHLELNEHARWFDLETAVTMAGSGFVFYTTMGTKVIYALTRLLLRNNVSFGFQPVLPPYVITEKGLYNSSNLPKFAGDYYKIEGEDLNLIPTAEVSLTNVYAGKILSADQLPLRMTAWTSCFRREAGTYGSTERGLIRIHQFEKVELYSICDPEKSYTELEHMVGCAESLLQQLGLHYRVSLLATQDCSFASAKTFDIEVWLPGQDRYYEVSSCSNCTDFQARRAHIRYRKSDAKPALAHTLNSSSLALPRLMVALMENGQQPDGSIVLPPVLQQEINALW
ncbi:MAG: serine--tRNA ligase [Candidatus Babeliales bacterium]|jgi:seryl-tRNA synthetase